MKVVIIDYGAGNIKSIDFALKRLGVHATLSNKSHEITSADKIIFPGVGEASSAMNKLIDSQLHLLIPQLKQPVLGICLGMQLMCNSSQEGNTVGLGIFDTEVVKFSNNNKVPQIGWNTISNLKSSLFNEVEERSYIYMVHSYYAPLSNQTIAMCNYGGNYSAALQNKNFYGTQFHPEKSGRIGAKILNNFLTIKH